MRAKLNDGVWWGYDGSGRKVGGKIMYLRTEFNIWESLSIGYRKCDLKLVILRSLKYLKIKSDILDK